MKTVLAAAKLLLKDIAGLSKPTLATAVAGIVVPIAASILGAHLTVAEVSGWLVIAGGLAGTLEKVTNGKAAAAVAAK